MPDTRTPQTEIPAALIADFGAIQCECLHGPNIQCPNTARLFVVYHCMGRCQWPQFQPDGENSEFLCWPCFHSLVALIVGNILRMLTHGHPPECTACHKPTPTPNEVISKVEPL